MYDFKKYIDQDRWNSYYHQIKEILSSNPKNVLEIGVGDKIVGTCLKVDYKSLDLDEKLNPDIVASVENMPIDDNSFDVVCAFEVLEHLPYEKFEQCLFELKRVSRGRVIISLPHWGRHFSVKIRLPFFKIIKFQFKLAIPIKHKFDGEHYWEIGKKGYPLKRIKKSIEKVFKIERDYVCFDSPYHHFFIIK